MGPSSLCFLVLCNLGFLGAIAPSVPWAPGYVCGQPGRSQFLYCPAKNFPGSHVNQVDRLKVSAVYTAADVYTVRRVGSRWRADSRQSTTELQRQKQSGI